MNLYDVVYDKDSYIDGILINEHNKVFNVMWRNNVIGIVTENDDALDFVTHINMKAFYIEDILHSGNSGEEYTRKIGVKYDNRRNKIALLDMATLKRGRVLTLFLFEPSFFDNIQNTGYQCKKLHTTEFDSMFEKDGCIMLRTLNSIYQLREV